MKSSVALIAVFAAIAVAPSASAANFCMSAPLASFDGYGAMSTDGHYLVAGDRLMSLPDLRELGRVPKGGVRTFASDGRHFLVLTYSGNGGPGTLDVVDVAAPGAPPHHLDFTTTLYPEVSANGTLLLIHPGERDVPDPQALDGKDSYYTTQVLRVADGRVVAQLDRGYEDSDWATDASERHVMLFNRNIASDGGEVNLVDVATGQIRRLASQANGKVALSPDGAIAVASDIHNERTTFWDVNSGNSLGTVAGAGWLAITPDSNWFFMDDIAVKRGNWSTPYRVPGFTEGTNPLLPLNGRVYAETTRDGVIAALDGGSLQPIFRGPSLGHHFWQMPKASPGNEYVAWSSDANDAEEDKVMGSSNLAVLDGRSGALVCHRTIAQPAEFKVLGVTATRVVVQESVDYKNPVVKLYAIENEAAAQARLQRENVQAKAQSAKLSPAKRAEAQAAFKQAFDLFQSGEFATAARLFENGLAIDPGNAVASYYLGETYVRLGDKDRAAVYYRRAADVAPNTKEGALAVTRLSN